MHTAWETNSRDCSSACGNRTMASFKLLTSHGTTHTSRLLQYNARSSGKTGQEEDEEGKNEVKECWHGLRIRCNDVTPIWVWSFTFISQQKQGLYSKTITASEWLNSQPIYRQNYCNSLWLVRSCISKWKQYCGRKKKCGRKEVIVWQETVTFPLLQSPELIALPSQQGSVSVAPKAHFQIEPGLLNAPNYVPSRPARTPQFPLLVFEQARFASSAWREPF